MKRFLIVGLVIAATSMASAKESAADAQIQFVTDFYHQLLDGHRGENPNSRFFSKSLQQFLEKDLQACKEKSRGDDMCGVDSGGDLFTNAQDGGPGLNFKNSEFKAKSAGKNLIEASFTLSPGDHDYYARKMKFQMIQDGGQWKVDDLFSEDSDQKFVSLRTQIQRELDDLSKEAKNLASAKDWVTTYVQEAGFGERLKKFVQFPVEICEKPKACVSVSKTEEKAYQLALQQLQDYFGKDPKTGEARHDFPGPKDFGVKESKDPKEGQVVPYGPFVFSFQKGAWWISKIDLSKLAKGSK